MLAAAYYARATTRPGREREHALILSARLNQLPEEELELQS